LETRDEELDESKEELREEGREAQEREAMNSNEWKREGA